jgi:hypothetical protein
MLSEGLLERLGYPPCNNLCFTLYLLSYALYPPLDYSDRYYIGIHDLVSAHFDYFCYYGM